MTDRIEIDPRRLLGIRITLEASAHLGDTDGEAAARAAVAARIGTKLGTKVGQKPLRGS